MSLILISVFPVIVIMIYLYYRDKYEKEPLITLFKAFSGGLLSAVLTIVVLMPFGSMTEMKSGLPLNDALTGAFLWAAIPEEFFKFLCLFIFIWRDRHFNEHYDGIIYAAFVSLGFALFENILYVFQMGMHVGISRAIITVPAHALFGVIMGYYFSMAKFNPSRRFYFLLLSLSMAILAHGIFDFLLMYSSGISQMDPTRAIMVFLGFFIFVAFLWRLGFRKIRKHVEASAYQSQISVVEDDQEQIE